MEKRKRHYSLSLIKELVHNGQWRATRVALDNAREQFDFVRKDTEHHRQPDPGGAVQEEITMKQKQWKNCPSCGAKESIKLIKNFRRRFKLKSYSNLNIEGLSEYRCKKCKDGIYTIESDNLIESMIAEHKAYHDAKKTPVSEIIPVSKASDLLHMTRQGVQKLMKSGKLEYVLLEDKRFPKRRAVLGYGT